MARAIADAVEAIADKVEALLVQDEVPFLIGPTDCGKTSAVRHTGEGIFQGVPNPFEATRYHSLVVERTTLPEVLEITAETDDGLIMGLRHRELDVEGVQFHPESILTANGHDLLRNFLRRCDD